MPACMCVCVREPDDGWSVLTCAAHWTVRLDMARLPAHHPLRSHSLSASLPQGQTCHVAAAHSRSVRLFPSVCASRLPLPCSVTFSGVGGQMAALRHETYFY